MGWVTAGETYLSRCITCHLMRVVLLAIWLVSLTLFLPRLVPPVSSIITSVSDPLHSDQLISFTWQNTDQAEYVLQLGALAVVPYIAETIIEMGLVRAFLTLLQQVRVTFRPTPN